MNMKTIGGMAKSQTISVVAIHKLYLQGEYGTMFLSAESGVHLEDGLNLEIWIGNQFFIIQIDSLGQQGIDDHIEVLGLLFLEFID